jgi:polyferredoxin
MTDLQKEIQIIKQRNKRVELDKARETSWIRKISIALLTYIVIVLFFYTAKLSNPWVNAIVPTMGFVLSTLSL